LVDAPNGNPNAAAKVADRRINFLDKNSSAARENRFHSGWEIIVFS